MNQLLKIAQNVFAVSLIGFGIMQFLTGNMILGRVPSWDFNIEALAYLTGLIPIAAGAALLFRKYAPLAAIFIGIVMFAGPILRDVPLIIASNHFGSYWTNFFKYLALAGGSFIVASSFPSARGLRKNLLIFADIYGRFSLAAFLIVCGIQHFMFPDFVKLLVPSWIPGNLFWTYFAGIALIAAGAGLLLNRTTHLAALLSGCMIFTWFLILHIPRAVVMKIPGEWFGVIESMAFSGILFVLAVLTNKSRVSVK